MGSGWLNSVDAAFATSDIKMVFGPVKIEADQTFFSKVQAMEFSSLIGAGAATLALGAPSMCNGANLAFRKEVFLEVGGFDGNLQVASGDDEFLMRKIAAQYPHGISFNHAQDAIVVTQPQRSLSAFVSQRLRWAGKWKYNQDLLSKLLALLIVGFHATVLSLPFFLMAGLLNAYVLVSLLVLRALVEFIFIRSVTAWLGVRWHGPSFLLLQLLYPVYAVGIGLASWFVHPAWKGRK
jgi:poly-beta-1,6-N-acetyl-D-glucosamine synthase